VAEGVAAAADAAAIAGERHPEARMQVAAFITPRDARWRWRIINYAGDVIEESAETFGSIASAVAEGSERLLKLNVVDRSEPFRPWRRSAHVRRD
jgi:hypothetical protein